MGSIDFWHDTHISSGSVYANVLNAVGGAYDAMMYNYLSMSCCGVRQNQPISKQAAF